MSIPISSIRAVLEYTPETGLLVWKTAGDKQQRLVGAVAGSAHNKGYIRLQVFGVRVLAHRAAWAIHYGAWPKGQIDHINGVKTDNRIVNLRVCNSSQNSANRPKMAGRYTSNFQGVYKAPKGLNRWASQCAGVHIGTFDSEEAAARAYDAAALIAFGEFAVLNFGSGA